MAQRALIFYQRFVLTQVYFFERVVLCILLVCSYGLFLLLLYLVGVGFCCFCGNIWGEGGQHGVYYIKCGVNQNTDVINFILALLFFLSPGVWMGVAEYVYWIFLFFSLQGCKWGWLSMCIGWFCMMLFVYSLGRLQYLISGVGRSVGKCVCVQRSNNC